MSRRSLRVCKGTEAESHCLHKVVAEAGTQHNTKHGHQLHTGGAGQWDVGVLCTVHMGHFPGASHTSLLLYPPPHRKAVGYLEKRAGTLGILAVSVICCVVFTKLLTSLNQESVTIWVKYPRNSRRL
jgi:hypothetical protein